jgi:hypothetical protein
MKQAEIAAKVFESLDSQPMAEVGGGAVSVPADDRVLPALVPCFCDPSVQWAVRLTPATQSS